VTGGGRTYTDTAFVGRRNELDGLARALDAHRLVTLTGPGGSGKTRLATEVVAGRTAEPDEAPAFIELAPLGPDAIGAAVALAVGATAHAGRGADDPVARAVAHLGESTRLLV
jgi:predicted ATPase